MAKKIPTNTETRDLCDLAAPTGNIYETVVILAKRANQIAIAEKKELTRKLEGFKNDHDSMEEVFENREQIEISKYYERQPKPSLVAIEEFKDEGTLVRIRAEIFCEKASHKGIIVGKHGDALKLIGTYAREDLEKLFGVKVYLNLWVKVKENWRESARTVSNFGYRDED